MSKLFETLQALEGQGRELEAVEAVQGTAAGDGGRTGRSSVTGLMFMALVVLSVVVGLYVADYMLDSSSIGRYGSERYGQNAGNGPDTDESRAVSMHGDGGGGVSDVPGLSEGEGVSVAPQAGTEGRQGASRSKGEAGSSAELSRIDQLMEQIPEAKPGEKAPGVEIAGKKGTEAKDPAVSLFEGLTKSQAGADRELLRQKEAARIARYRMKMLQAAEECRQRGDIEEAAGILRRLWRDWKEPSIANNLAACLILMKDYDTAKKILEEGLRLSPSDPDLLYNYRLLLSLKGEADSLS